jgi:hypothetical protein
LIDTQGIDPEVSNYVVESEMMKSQPKILPDNESSISHLDVSLNVGGAPHIGQCFVPRIGREFDVLDNTCKDRAAGARLQNEESDLIFVFERSVKIAWVCARN